MRPGPPIARSRRGRLAATVAVVALGAAGTTAFPAGAQLGGSDGTQERNRAKIFLQSVQNADGGVPTQRGKDSDPATSAWAALALASTGVSPRDQVRKGGGTPLWTYLREQSGELQSTDDLARLALVARAAKSSPEKVGSVTPIATIVSRQAAEGGIADQGTGRVSVVSTAWAVLALPDGKARRDAREWLKDARNSDGDWPATKGGAGDAVATGLALQALRRSVDATPSYRFLRSVQRSSGGLARRTGGAPDPLATALVIQGGVAAADESDLVQLSATGDDPTSYLWKQQRRTSTGAVGSILSTAKILPALAKKAYPLRAVSSTGPTNTGDPVDGAKPGDEEPTTTTTTTTSTTPGTSTAPNAVPGGEGDADSTGTSATSGGSGPPGDVAGAAPPTSTAAAPPTTTTTGPAPPAAPSTPGDQVTGSVVGSTEAAPAAATGGGGGGDDEDRSGLVLAGLIVLFVALGAWVERRPTRLRGVAS